ncbi:galactitol-1-phosphate 5-dehydrogenase [Slackia heliotrinireducens]|uniref:galactitol-1-phosphate 5-dehydrogenase n=1 Tax=Slackia heliotrinireducens TaxID=84110 RepID=UPI0033160F7D
MFAAQLQDTKTMEYLELPTPEPGAGQVQVRVHFTGICGSDVPRFHKGAVHNFPLVLGHEFSGEITAVGQGVDASLVGTRVSGIPLEPCGECEDCKNGNFSLCGHYGFVGSRSQGSMAEYVVLPVENVFPLGENVTDMEGALYEPATVALHGIELANFHEGASAIVIGAGTIGILLGQALSGYGAGVVVVSNHSQVRLDAAKAAGLENLVNTSEEGWLETAKAFIGGKGFDYVFDTAGTPKTIIDAMAVAGSKGTVVFVGTPKDDVAFTIREWEMLNRKELTLIGSWMSYSAPWPGVEWVNVDDFFNRGIMRVVPEMIDGVYKLQETAAAFDRFVGTEKVRGKILIDSWKEVN